MKKVVHLSEVPVKTVPIQEGHHGGTIQYVFNPDNVNAERIKLHVQTYPPGGFTVPEEHGVHDSMEQVYYMLEGEMEITLGDEVHRIGPGSCVYIPRNTLHGHKCIGKTDLKFLTFNAYHKDI